MAVKNSIIIALTNAAHNLSDCHANTSYTAPRATPRHNSFHLIPAKHILDVLKTDFFCFHFFEVKFFKINKLIRQLADTSSLKPLFWRFGKQYSLSNFF